MGLWGVVCLVRLVRFVGVLVVVGLMVGWLVWVIVCGFLSLGFVCLGGVSVGLVLVLGLVEIYCIWVWCREVGYAFGFVG